MGRTPKLAWALLAYCALLLLSAPHRTLAQADHRLVWRTIRGATFDVHYHEPLGQLARELLTKAESAHARIKQALPLPLRQRVQLVLADDDDAPNGFANALPYNAIHLRAVAPDDMSPLADYDDWLDTLVTHEHTHVLHLEQSSGIPRLLQRVFGRFYSPQHNLPDWFTEGLAVLQESAQTTGGRARSTHFDMYLRMDVLEGRVLPIDWISFDGEPWPHGNVRYLYGQAFVRFIAARYGTDALARFITEYGRRLVPYSLNRSLRRVTGASFVALYGQFRDQLRLQAEQTRDRVVAQGLLEGTRITRHGELTRSPRFLSNGQLVYAVADARHVPELRKLTLHDGSQQRLARVISTAQPARVVGSTRVVFSALDYYRGRYSYQELFSVEADGRARRLTSGVRAREPDVSPDGRTVAFVTHAAGTSHLELADLTDIAGTRRIVVRSRVHEQVFTPRFSPDGKYIAYSAWSRGGYRDLWLLEIATGVRTRLTYDRALDRGPVFSPDGTQLYFSSDRSGIANLYVLTLATNHIEQLTNVLGGAFQPDVSPDGKQLVYVGYGSKGFDLFLLPLATVRARPAQPSFQRPESRPQPAPLALTSQPYRPYATLYPRSYELGTEDLGSGTRLVLNTHGADVVGFHAISLRYAQDLDENQRAVDVAYAYTRPRYPLYLRAALQRFETRGFIANGRDQLWDARAMQLSAGTSFSFPRGLRGLVLRAQYDINLLEHAAPLRFEPDPGEPPPTFPSTGYNAGISASITHATAQAQPFDISRSWGHVVTLWGAWWEPALGARVRDVSFGGRAEQFIRFDFRESVLAMAYSGSWNRYVRLGGYSSQTAPILDALIMGASAPGDYARLRGFPMRAGDQLHVAQMEYRFLISRINRGLDTLPVFARRVHAALFSDAGDAFFGRFDARRIGVSTGAELRLDWAGGGYGYNYTLRGGVARGITTGGVWQWYTTLAYPF